MNKYNLLPAVGRKRYIKVRRISARYFVAEMLNKKWMTDNYYIRTGQGLLYFSIILI